MTHKSSVLRLLICISVLGPIVGPSASLAALGVSLAASRVSAQSNDETPKGLDENDWSSILAAYASNRHAVFAAADGFRARNPGQGWLTRFDGRGVSTEPDAGGWTWGLQLERYGFAAEERDVCEPKQVSAHGERVAYDWDATLQEWWINDARGLEHGYTVQERPPHCAGGPLVLTLAVRGDLQPRVRADGRGVDFADDAGVERLTYAGLVVFDADGVELAARFGQNASTLRLSIDESGARYPLTIDPLVQQAYLKASNTNAGDYFGHAVSVSGNTAVVGAIGESSNAVGVNGNQADNSALFAGAAYVFVRTGMTWSQQAYLKASNSETNDQFGWSVSVSGDTVVVGTRNEGSNAIGVNGPQTNNLAPNSGAAYVYVRTGTTWSQQAYLKASNAESNDEFGYSLSLSGDTLVVGAVSEGSNATGVNGNQSDNGALGSGAAYVFVRSGTTWSQQAYIKASNTESQDEFGYAVSVSGDTLVVTADREDSNAGGVNGNQADNSAGDAGAAYVFTRSGTTWSQQAYLKASNSEAADRFGWAVSVSGDTLVVSAVDESSDAIGVNGNQADNSFNQAGAAYVFTRSGTTWSQQAYLKASNTDGGDFFGNSVSVSGDTIVVGAPYEASNAVGVNGNQLDNSATDSGAVYVFTRSGTTWSQQSYVKASNTEIGDNFGFAVSVSGGTIVIGAIFESSNAVGVNGNQADNGALDSGAVYVFDTNSTTTPFCFGDGSGTACPCGNNGVAGNGCSSSVNAHGARVSGSGLASIASDSFVLTGGGMPNSSALYFQGTAQANGGLGTAFGDGLRCASGSIIRLGIKTNASGTSQYPSGADPTISVRGLNAAGNVRTYQIWYRNAAVFCNVETFNLSNGLQVTWGP